MRHLAVLFWLLFFWSPGVVLPSAFPVESAAFHSRTDWQLKPSLKYDALCLLNALSGDPYYLHYYQAEYDHFHPLFTTKERAAFVQLKYVIKDNGGGIISANVALYFSAVDAETLPEMIRTARDSTALETALRKTPYWSDDEWRIYQQARPALETALEALDRAGFAAYWVQTVKPKIEHRIAELSHDLPKYNIVPAIEARLGFPLPSQTITVYLLAYSEPHGIRITGLRFLTHESYPFDIVVHNAIHEAMHPPYDAHDSQVQEAIDLLGRDPLVVDKVNHHDASFGYNTAPGYIEEDSVQALEQIVSEEFGVGRNAPEYWREQDGGMHLLATAIYVEYKSALSQSRQPYSKWFVHAVDSGDLRGDKLRDTVKGFFSASAAQNSNRY